MTTLRDRLFGKTVEKEFDINGVKIKIKALSEREHTEAWSKVSSMAQVSAVRTHVLARAILFLDGKPFLETQEVRDTLRKLDRAPIQDELYEAAENYLSTEFSVSEIDHLYDLYTQVYEEDRKRVEDLKKA